MFFSGMELFMKAVVIAGGDIYDYEAIKKLIDPDDFIICADSGFLHAKKMGIRPNIVMGDFDSCTKPDEDGFRVITYPPEKDFSDTYLAVDTARKEGYRNILILGAIGSRFDHTLANYHLLYYLMKQGVFARIVNENNEIFLIEHTYRVDGKKGDKIALIPLFSDVTVTAQGLYYPLNQTKLSFDVCTGISNVFLEDTVEISVEGGVLSVIKFKE